MTTACVSEAELFIDGLASCAEYETCQFCLNSCLFLASKKGRNFAAFQKAQIRPLIGADYSPRIVTLVLIPTAPMQANF